MRNFIKFGLLMLSVFLSFSGYAADKVRLVFSGSPNATEVKALTTQRNYKIDVPSCVSSNDGKAKWCIGDQFSGNVRQQDTKSFSSIVIVDSQGYSAEYIAQSFNADGRFGIVEVDVQISAKPTESVPDMVSDVKDKEIINDPAFSVYQKPYYFTDHASSASGANILGLWDLIGLGKIKDDSNPLDVLVLDSEFEMNQDVKYFDGRSFSTTALLPGDAPQLPGDDFSVRDVVDDVCDAHGLQVASVIGGTIDNGYGQAGIINNVRLHALRVMTCGVGFLSDSANALKWAAGQPFANSELVTPYSGQAGFINMSLSGASDTCPNFMQEGIDAARDAGFTIVVAAGNQAGDSNARTPANCDGVITVAALDRDGRLPAFTNRGSSVDISALGVLLPTPCEDSDITCLMSGTSLSSPLVTGVLATVKRESGADDKMLKLALSMTARPTQDPLCEEPGMCGAGMVDAKSILSFVRKVQAGNLHTVEHALTDRTECEQKWLIDYFGNEAPICSMYNFSLLGGFSPKGINYRLISIPKDTNWDNAEPVHEGDFNTSRFTLTGLDITTRQYAVQICEAGLCANTLPVNIGDVTPEICK